MDLPVQGELVSKERALTVGAAIALTAMMSALPAVAEQVPRSGIWVDAPIAAAQPEVRGGVLVEGEGPNTYGTSGFIGYAAGPCDAYIRSGSVEASNYNCVNIEPAADGNLNIGFPIHLPSGASIQYLRLSFHANSVAVGISAGLFKAKEGGVTLIADASPPLISAGNSTLQVGPFSETVDNSPNDGYTYHFNAILQKAGTAVTGIHKVYVVYKLQVSPAPAIATFSDVPVGHWAFPFVEALAASGVTAGCGSGKYCPDRTLTRAEMAVFLASALGLQFPW